MKSFFDHISTSKLKYEHYIPEAYPVTEVLLNERTNQINLARKYASHYLHTEMAQAVYHYWKAISLTGNNHLQNDLIKEVREVIDTCYTRDHIIRRIARLIDRKKITPKEATDLLIDLLDKNTLIGTEFWKKGSISKELLTFAIQIIPDKVKQNELLTRVLGDKTDYLYKISHEKRFFGTGQLNDLVNLYYGKDINQPSLKSFRDLETTINGDRQIPQEECEGFTVLSGYVF